jgi:hypothetical protein
MKRTFILFSLLFIGNLAYSQDPLIDENDSTVGWKVRGRVGLGFSQVALSNWAAGGENAFSGTAYLRLAAVYKKDKTNWENYLSTIYGLQKQGDNDIQKNEDNIEIISKYGYQVANKWYYTVNLNFRTQYAPGYATPEDSVKISDFFAPAYLNLATGMDFKPNDNFSLLLAPVSGKFTFVMDDFLSSIGQFGVDPGKKTRSEFGGTIQMIYTKPDIIKNVSLTTNLDLFSNYLENPEKIDVNWQLYIDFKVNDFLSLSLNTHLIYDYDVKFVEIQDGQEVVTDKVQFKEAFTFGLAFTFDAK